MSDDSRPGVTRQDLPDEMPRVATSDQPGGPPAGRKVPALVWLLLAVFVAALFALLLRLAGPPTQGIGQQSADVVVPAAPPVRGP